MATPQWLEEEPGPLGRGSTDYLDGEHAGLPGADNLRIAQGLGSEGKPKYRKN